MPDIKTIAVTGSQGQLGKSIHAIATQYPQYQFTFLNREHLDLSNTDDIAAYFKQHRYDAIINCAAYTAVDKAETEKELADKINHLAVEQLAHSAKQANTLLIHISTDYVFDGTQHKPYIETDTVNPQSVYGATKLKGEQAIQRIQPHAAIIRTSWVYSEFGQNFVKTMLKLGIERDQLTVIYDQIGSPTYAGDLARSILQSLPNIKNNTVECYHFSNEGVCSWYDFAKQIFEIKQIQCKVTPIETKDYPTPAKRPHYSLLNKAKIKQLNTMEIPYWKDSLKQCLKAI